MKLHQRFSMMRQALTSDARRASDTGLWIDHISRDCGRLLGHQEANQTFASCELRAASRELESDGTEELRVSGCVSIANSHELTAEVAPVRVTPYSFHRPAGTLDDLPAVSPEYQVNDRWNHVLEEVASRRHAPLGTTTLKHGSLA